MIATWLALVPAERRRTLVGYAAATLTSVILRAAAAVLLVPLVAALFGQDPTQAVIWLGWLTAVTVAGWTVDTVAARAGFALGFAVLDHAQHDLADRLPTVRLEWFTADNTAGARQAIAATGPELVGLVIALLTPLITGVLLPGAIAVGLLGVSWQLGVAALAGLPLLLGALWASTRLSRRADVVADQANTALTERIIEFARTQQALRSARRVDAERSLVGAALATQHSATMRLLLMLIPGQVVFSLASQAALILLAGATTLLTLHGALAVPQAIALIVVIARYLEPFNTVAELAPALEATRASLARIRAVLTAPILPTGSATLSGSPGSNGSAQNGPAIAPPRIEFDDVSFDYGAGPVLDGVSFALAPGTTTAVVGPSGSGKSTVLSLIAGLRQPTGGRVLLDGVDAADLTAGARRDATSVVFQEPYLFDGTVADNIRSGDPGADESRLARAMSLARVDELVNRLPDGAETAVGEAGGSLSGGERQRISIARALLKPAPVLLIDEATSALDNENETAVVDALDVDLRDRTRVIVAHRLASIRKADRVLFLERGTIVEDGSIDELLGAGGRFAEFWRQQSEAAGWRIGATRDAAPAARP